MTAVTTDSQPVVRVAYARRVAESPPSAELPIGVFDSGVGGLTVFREIARVLKPGGRLQIADIIVQRAVPEAAKENVDLWTG